MSDIVNKIKDAADIVELVSEFVPLKKSGANYVGVCPFHNDSKPSMFVNPSKGIFKCFACGAGGDVIKFWTEYHKKDFKDAIKELAQRYGIPYEFKAEDKEAKGKFENAVRMHELASQYYMDKLLADKDAQHARDYLVGRGITTATILEFKLGYSPKDQKDWGRLIKFIQSKMSVNEEEIQEAGLAGHSEKSNRFFDKFRGRLMIPIQDERSRVIAFGARALRDPETNEEDEPKYLNSSDSTCYTKGDNLYGLNLAKDFIRKQDAAIIVEGYFDQISLYQAGFKNVVANQGTALTPKQSKLVTKFSDSKKVLLCFDTDNAGEKASEKAFEVIMQNMGHSRPELRTIRVPDGKDPDDLIRNGGTEVFQSLIDNAPLFFDYQIDKHCHSRLSPSDKAKALREVAKYLVYMSSQVELAGYTSLVSSKLNIELNSTAADLQSELKQIRKTLPSNEAHHNPYKSRLGTDGHSNNFKPKPQISNQYRSGKHILYADPAIKAAEQEMLLLGLKSRSLLEDFLASDMEFKDVQFKEILDTLIDISFENPDLDDADIKFELLKEKLSSNINLSTPLADLAMSIEEDDDKASSGERFNDIIRRLTRINLQTELDHISLEIKNLGDSDDDKWIELENQKKDIVKRLQAV